MARAEVIFAPAELFTINFIQSCKCRYTHTADLYVERFYADINGRCLMFRLIADAILQSNEHIGLHCMDFLLPARSDDGID